ncbi:HutD family protein [Noviherbaspirillum saxi]|uniref:HutD family protein n=1 Tax=Noviherbaspirillum saxi TaxID=2320863 RepID=A0A3A3G157_9BURK|nr:HutD family protein [Noviherbaspirillum saxi]RJF91803.1 HutD family protein [Noviherbaspirillum saxi]
MPIHAQHYNAAAYRVVPWKNGLGSTRELTDTGSGIGFAWRISVPEIVQAGPFSRFDGVDRLLILLEGTGLGLRCGQRDEMVLKKPFDTLYFPGDEATESRLCNGPVRVFNIMAARDKARFSASVLHLEAAPALHHPAPRSTTLVHCLRGSCRLAYDAAQHELGVQETLRLDTVSGGERIVLSSASSATIIKIDIVNG